MRYAKVRITTFSDITRIDYRGTRYEERELTPPDMSRKRLLEQPVAQLKIQVGLPSVTDLLKTRANGGAVEVAGKTQADVQLPVAHGGTDKGRQAHAVAVACREAILMGKATLVEIESRVVVVGLEPGGEGRDKQLPPLPKGCLADHPSCAGVLTVGMTEVGP